MKKHFIKIKIALYMILAVLPISVLAQTVQPTADFSLQSAIDYALKHNVNYLNAELDVKMAQYKNKEVLGAGLPQIGATADLKDYFDIPTSLLPGQIFGGPAGTFIPVKFGTQYNATGGGSVTQLIFSSDYIVGLQAAKEFRILSERNVNRTKVETIVTVTKAYYSALINRERIKTLEANIIRVKKTFDDTKALNTNGFVEKIDVERIELMYNNLLTEKEKLMRLIGLTETLLKFQMGYDLKQPIKLTDELKAEQLGDIDLLMDTKINYDARPEFTILQSQQKLNNLDVRRYRLQYLPSLVGYASYTKQAQRTTFDIFDFSKKWFPIGIVGATLNIPIFSGGQKYFRIQQAKISLQKTNNSITNLKSFIEFEATSGAISYKNAFASMITQKKNKELAQNIYDTSMKKYTAGVGSNLEVVIAETALREAETNYLSAIYDLVVAKTDLDRALGNIK